MQLQKQHALWLSLICIVAVAYALWLFNPFHYYFLNDDLIHIPLSKEGVLFQRRSFRPLCDLSIRLDFMLWGKNAAGYHFTNLLLHVTNTLLVFRLSLSLIKKYGDNANASYKSIMVAVLFFVYAFHSETILWILGRSASLGVLCFIPSLIFYLRRHRSNTSYILSLLFFTLGLLTYESTWIFPLVVILFAVIDKRYFHIALKKEIVFVLVVLLLFTLSLVLRHQVIGEVAGNYEATNFTDFDLVKLSLNFFRLLVRCFAPPFQNGRNFIIAGCLLFAALAIMLLAVYRKLKQDRIVLFSFILLLVSFIPYLSLGVDTHAVEGERFLYLPSVFACMVLIYLLHLFAQKIKNQLLIFSLLVAYQLLFLYHSSVYYSTAGNISSTVFKEINLLKGKKRLYIDSLPQSYNGALIFRLGFEEGVKWLKEQGTVDTVIVVSLKANNANWSSDYQSQKTGFIQPHVINSILVRELNKGYFLRQITPVAFNPATDAWFVFKDEGLEFYK